MKQLVIKQGRGQGRRQPRGLSSSLRPAEEENGDDDAAAVSSSGSVLRRTTITTCGDSTTGMSMGNGMARTIIACLFILGSWQLMDARKNSHWMTIIPTSASRVQEQQNSSPSSSASASSSMTTITESEPAYFFCLCPSRKEKCNTDYCDTVLTYKVDGGYRNRSSSSITDSRHDYTLLDDAHVPNSTWTTARNLMYHMSKQILRRSFHEVVIRDQQQQQYGHVPSHFCFMDGDTRIVGINRDELQTRLQQEVETNKIIAFNMRGYLDNNIHYKYGADANVNCYHYSSIDRYLPYSTLLDDQAWSLAQADIWAKANLIEPFAFKVGAY
jgi:hypothetical protein